MAHGNNTIKIPGELQAADINGIVASAEAVKDYNQNKTQEVINADTALAIQTEHNRAVTAEITNAQAISTLDNTIDSKFSTQDSTIAAKQAEIQAEQAAQRTYIEEGFASQNLTMSTMQGTINAKQLELGAVQTDDVPTQNSGNFMTSGSIYQTLTDPLKNFVEADNPSYASKKLATSGMVFSFGEKTDNSQFKFALTDAGGNVVAYLDNDDVLNFKTVVKNRFGHSLLYRNNMDKDAIIMNDCRYGKANQLFQALVIADSHEQTNAYKNAIEGFEDFESLQCIIHLGDHANSYKGAYDTAVWKMMDENKTVPIYPTIGNHDIRKVGAKQVDRIAFDDDLFDKYLRPIIRNGNLFVGEYQDNKMYYYHDFDKFNIRLICLYPFDDSQELDTSKWYPITYDPSYPIAEAGSYVAGDKINMPNFTKWSFQAVNAITVSYSPLDPPNYATDFPSVKVIRWNMWYSQEQLEWFCRVLDGAGAKGYNCIIIQHFEPFGDGAAFQNVDHNTRFSCPTVDYVGAYWGRVENAADTNIITRIVNAFQTGGNVQAAYEAQNNNMVGSDPVSEIVDFCDYLTPINLNYSFQHSGKCLFLTGHNHRDVFIRSTEFEHVNDITVTASKEMYVAENIRSSYGKRNYDIDTVITPDFDNMLVHITRIGADTTTTIGEDGRLVKKDNEIINL